MALYLVASLVGVVLIVFVIMQLTKASPNSSATGSSTSSPGTATAAKNTLAFTQAASVGKYPLNRTATKQFGTLAQGQAAPIAAEIKAKGAGSPGSDVVALYDLSSVTSVTSSAYKGIAFVGYDGTFNPSAVIKLERTKLESSRMVKAGPNGGEMICGYNTSSGSDQEHLGPGPVRRRRRPGEVPGRGRVGP
jgi:hypothetical protein